MKKKMWILGLTYILVLVIGADILAQNEVTEEELLFMEIPIVVTAARREQPITEVPAAVTVITAEDIKQSGANNIPDILRAVPGVDVLSITVRDHQVSVHGFNEYMSNKLLVMIDGRSIYWDAEGCVFWDLIPISLEEIERIEIVKSPSSSLYGANAYCGVINIITRSPDKIKGTKLSLTGGDYSTYLTSILHAGVSEKISYKVSAGSDRTNEWRNKDERAGDITRANALVEYKIGQESKLSILGGRVYSKNKKFFSAEALGAGELTGNWDYVQLNYDYPNIKLHTFLKEDNVDTKWVRTNDILPWLTKTYDAEIQHYINIGKKNILTSGANYRHNTVEKNNLIPGKNSQDLWALFLEDEIKIKDKIRLTLGGRYDWHPLVKEYFSPRGNITYSPFNEHIFRLSIGKAYRNPTFIDSYLQQEEQAAISLPKPLHPIPFTYINYGNKDLKPEGITSYEAGYRSTWLKKKIITNLNLFYNQYTDSFTYSKSITPYTAAEIKTLLGFDPGISVPKKIVIVRKNGGDTMGIGGEINFDILFTSWLSGITNYSFQKITDKEDNPLTSIINEKDRVRPEYPKNKVNTGLKMKLENGVSANVLVHWVDKTKRFIYDRQGNEYLSDVDAYTILNVRVGYTFINGNTEASLSVFNLFNDKHYEYPVGINLPDPSSDKIGRRISANISYKF